MAKKTATKGRPKPERVTAETSPTEEQVLAVSARAPESAPIFYVHGAWGGIGPRGEIVVYLFQETQSFPERFELTVNPEGRVINEKSSGSWRVQREVLAKLILPPDVAASVGKWLVEKAEALAKIKSVSPADSESAREK